MLAKAQPDVGRDTVILVHGLLANTSIMRSLARWLEPSFLRVCNWGYDSIWSPIERHAERLADLMRGLDRDGPHDRIHLVTHSMGGIIARVALAEYLPERFGRFVMIAPPNRGSHVARRLAPFLGRICPPLVQLADDAKSFVCCLPRPTVRELGIIAAQTDYLVPEECTRLGCECDYIVLPGLHSSLLWRQETADQVRHFLQNGKFNKAAIASSHLNRLEAVTT
jgi:pimeloyl-ACP methyl ester carboxylesterase